ncbi:MAG TPA: hypothetical protein VGC15_20900 [Acetobacteraceae bacterium]
MTAWVFGLLLVGTMLMLGGGYAYGNATMVVMEQLNPAVAAAVRRQRRFYAGCMGLAGLGVLLLCTAIWMLAVEGAEPGWPLLAGAGAFAAAGAAAAVCGALRLLG